MIGLKGVFAASLSILKSDLSLDIDNTIRHAENVIDTGCHGAVFFGSTGQSQLISLSEKIQLINQLPKSRYRDKFIIGTGLNSLADNINLIKISKSMNFNTFLASFELWCSPAFHHCSPATHNEVTLFFINVNSIWR